MERDTYCSFCGTAYPEPRSYPRRCATCGISVWANPIPVSVVLVPVRWGAEPHPGLLVVRRTIPPHVGSLCLTGGFLEAHESWQVGGAREVYEESGLLLDPASLETHWFASTEPNPRQVLLFSTVAPLPVDALPPFLPSSESSERGLVFGPDGLADVFAFPLHIEAARRWFGARGIGGPHRFTAA